MDPPEADDGPDPNGAGVAAGPDQTAVRVALWRALHVQVDSPPHVLEDVVGLQLAAPDAEWRQRPDMDADFTKAFRAAIVARARYIEDLVADQADHGVSQYVLLGAGLDSFAQRRPEVASRLHLFEVDRPAPQAWKRDRLVELGFGVPDWLRLVPVDFESESWWERLTAFGFDPARATVVASTGVSMYLTKEANRATLDQMATLAPGSTVAMTFLLPMELLDEEDREGLRMAEIGARSSGTPFLSFFSPTEILELARKAGFRSATHVSLSELATRYFADRTDSFRPSTGEDLLVAHT